ncbi:hypothetical protein [Candidatus Erwinia haradaeae]|uniref:hypothetical protein n=1 Tax=Candidatus Erwinia haradaeae TaxID=1922217 RepID=UPI001300B884|nr:hypothetical protein [Candidatus Erwinia haradaeae]
MFQDFQCHLTDFQKARQMRGVITEWCFNRRIWKIPLLCPSCLRFFINQVIAIIQLIL